MVFRITAVLFVFLASMGCLASARGNEAVSSRQIYAAMTMQDVAETLDLLGLTHQQQDIEGKNIVANTRLAVMDGVTWFIYGYNCTKPDARPQACGELQLRALIETQADPEQNSISLNQWNQQNRFARVYTSDSDKTIILEMDIYLSGGITLSNFVDQLLLWRGSLRKFALFLED